MLRIVVAQAAMYYRESSTFSQALRGRVGHWSSFRPILPRKMASTNPRRTEELLHLKVVVIPMLAASRLNKHARFATLRFCATSDPNPSLPSHSVVLSAERVKLHLLVCGMPVPVLRYNAAPLGALTLHLNMLFRVKEFPKCPNPERGSCKLSRMSI